MESFEVIIGRRKRASELIFGVLTEKINVLSALKEFPQSDGDKSLEAAWHALMHYEADEDIRKKDAEYAHVQDDCLESIASDLAKGQNLPINIISTYTNFYKDTPAAKKHGLFDCWGIFGKYLNVSPKKNKKL